MRFDTATEALMKEAEYRYHTDAKFHTTVDISVQASMYHPSILFTSEDLETFVRGLLVKSTSLALVLREHTDND